MKLNIKKEIVYLHDFKYISKFKENMPMSFEKKCEDGKDVFDFVNTTDVTEFQTAQHKLFPGILYKNLRGFEPNEIIKEMKEWLNNLHNA